MMIWMRLVEGMIKTSGLGPPGAADAGETDLPADVISYFFMVWVSVILGGVLLIEQYFGRRIHCFNPVSFNEPAPAIAEYCWRHGDFNKNSTDGFFHPIVPDHGWLLQSYVYFLIRAFVFFLPHIMWNTKYRQWISAILSGTTDITRELEKLWLKFSDVADNAYSEYEDINNEKVSNETSTARKQRHQNELDKTYNAVMAMTRDVVQITKKQIPRYGKILNFVQLRAFYTLVVMTAYLILDLVFFTMVNTFDSTDFYCVLPNDETIRCMVPMMQFLWHGALVSIICSVFVFMVTLHHAMSLLISLCSSSTSGCFLERVPLSGMAADLSWKSARDRRTYKVISKFLMSNVCILHPLNFMEAFVQHMLEAKQVPGHMEKMLGHVPQTGAYRPEEAESMMRETDGL